MTCKSISLDSISRPSNYSSPPLHVVVLLVIRSSKPQKHVKQIQRPRLLLIESAYGDYDADEDEDDGGD